MTETHPAASGAGIADRRDNAVFYLNLSRTGGEVVPYRLDGRPAFLVNRPEHAAHVLSTNQHNYRNPPHPYAELAGHYAPAGSFMLQLNRRARVGAPAIERIREELIDASNKFAARLIELSSRAPVDVELESKKMMFGVVVRLLFDTDAAHLGEAFVRAVGFSEECWANGMFAARNAAPDALEQRFIDALETQDRTAAWIARAAGIAPHGDGDVSPDTKTAILRTLLNSYNATAATLCWSLHLLSQNPDALAKLRHEIDRALGSPHPTATEMSKLNYTRMVLMETLRLYPPAWMLGREAIAAEHIGSVLVPSGATVSVSPFTMHRHPRIWPRPNDFLPERFDPAATAAPSAARTTPFAYFPFGGGERKCPAGHLVVGHLQTVLALILRRCHIAAHDASHPPVKPRALISLRPSPGLFLRFTAR